MSTAKETKTHRNVGGLIRDYRTAQKGGGKKKSQTEVAMKLGWNNGQYISNIERGGFGIPSDKLATICEILNIPKAEMCEAVIADYRLHIQSSLELTADKFEEVSEKLAA